MRFWYLLIPAAAVLLLVVWILIERQILLTRKIQIGIPGLAPEYQGLRIVQISDLHHRQMGKDNCRIVRRVRRLRPDCIVITGDLVSRDMHHFTSTAHFLRQLRQICPVYLCLGNHELDLPPQYREKLETCIARSGCRLLQDETLRLRFWGSAPLYLAGIQLRYDVYRDENRRFRHRKDYTAADMEHALGKRRGTTIVLAHNPLFLESYAQWGADLVLCGHIHGGIVRLPFVGGVLSPERRFFPKYDKGGYRCGNTQMYVSGGIGKLRLWNPPELTFLELGKK